MDSFALKIIAVLTMLIDHSGAALAKTTNVIFGFPVIYLRIIGRVAFPIYAFLISEGCRHTKSMEKYLLRLGLFAVISEIPYDMFFGGLREYPNAAPVFWDFNEQNVFLTLFLGALAIYWHNLNTPRKETEKSLARNILAWIAHALVLALIFSLGIILKTDYGAKGVILIFAFYIFESKALKAIVGAVMLYALYIYAGVYAPPLNVQLYVGGAVSLLFIALYNGKRGVKAKWFFYIFYPAHLLALVFAFRALFLNRL